ncbi:MAG: M28 family peptidase [Acidobacteria bacterium]|nr:M28 family peptidase [Acidobacteriota bacterium]
MPQISRIVVSLVAVGLSLGATPESAPEKRLTNEGAAIHRASGRRSVEGDPFSQITADRLLTTLTELTSIGSNNGWRHSTTRGEEQAISWVEKRLSRMGFLRVRGLQLERQYFRTFLGIEFWQTRVYLRTNDAFIEVPASAPPGHRDRIDLAIRFDSDGTLNDTRSDPVTVEGAPILVRSAAEIDSLTAPQVAGRVVFLDYEVIDRVINDLSVAVERAWRIAELQPAGIVLVTSYSNRRGLSHGSFASDLPAFTWVEVDPLPPVMVVRLEDLDVAGVDSWNDLANLQGARLTWDVDLFSPGVSSFLMARIPGRDPSRAMILGAHIDSPNTPGALDNGSGSAALVEVARALDRSRTIPPVDLHLVWFGSHERGLFGSASFVSAHSELIDRSIAMLQMDCLGRPVDDISNYITLETWPYGRFGDDRILWPAYLEDAALIRGIHTEPVPYYGLGSDNGNFVALDLPSANMIFMNPYDELEVHYDNHLHDPYDTVELAQEVRGVYQEMAEVLLTAALRTAEDNPQLRVTPPATHRALFVGSHTEAAHMSAPSFTEFGMAMAWEGIDVDTVPYGSALTAADLEDTDMVIALPVYDYPSSEGDLSLYDEAWTIAEVDLLEDWVRDGGLLIITNSARRLKYVNYAYEDNEDWEDANLLAERFGVSFTVGHLGLAQTTATITSNHELVAGIPDLQLADDNAVRFSAPEFEMLARVGVHPVVALANAGAGEVLVLADLGILGAPGGQAPNLEFWRNLAEYVTDR